MASAAIEGFRVSPQQERIWTLAKTYGHLNSWSTILVEGNLDTDALQVALRRVVRANSILRTRFEDVAGLQFPLQVIDEYGTPDWQALDLSQHSASECEEQLRAALTAAREAPLDSEYGSCLRARLIQIEAGKHLLSLTVPALHADLQTQENLFAQIAEEYGRRVAGFDREGEPVQYIQVSEWLNDLAAEAEPIASTASPFVMPGERRTAASPFRSESMSVPVEDRVIEAIRAMVASDGLTEQCVWLALWYALLFRLTRENTVTVNVNFDGRPYEELRDVLGPCSRTAPLDVPMAARHTFREIAARTLAKLLEAAASLERCTYIGDDAARAPALLPAFDFDFRPAPRKSADVWFSLVAREHFAGPFSIRLKPTCEQGRTALELSWNPAAFERDSIAAISRSLIALAEEVIVNPDRPIRSAPLLHSPERERLLTAWNQTAAEFPSGTTVHDLISQRAALLPDAVAVRSASGDLSFKDLEIRSSQLAHYLRASGVRPEEPIGILMERSVEMITGILGVLKAGCAYVPLALTDPIDRVAFILKDAGIETILTNPKLKGLGESKRIVDLTGGWPQIEECGTPSPLPLTSPSQLAYIIYTSGSTGAPKGVLIEHAGLTNYLHWCVREYEVVNGNGAPLHSAISFDLSVTTLFAPLLAGRPISLVPENDGPEALASAMQEGTTFSFVKLTPSHLDLINARLENGALGSSTRALIIGGEALVGETINSWRQYSPQTRIINEYGPTETVVGCSVYEVQPGDPGTGPIPIGRPLANTELYIVDEAFEPVPVNVTGELLIGGAGVARGYLRRPSLTAEKFVPDAFSGRAGARLYRSADLARYRTDGVIEYLGRADSQVKLNGHRVELEEIEAVLRSHPAVTDAAAAVHGESGEQRLSAYVTLLVRPGPSSKELRQFLGQRIPSYMIPARFIVLDRMPLSASGKVDRKALPDPDSLAFDRDVPYAPPRNLAEELLASIWADVLGLDQVGIDDNFFALGGDSIRAIQVRAHAQNRGIRFSHSQLFERQTIRSLSEAVDASTAESSERIPPFALVSAADREKLPPDVEDAYPLTKLQAGMLYHSELEPETAVYHDLHRFTLRLPFNEERLRAAVQHTAANHAVLRTYFDLQSYGEPLQIVRSAVEIPLVTEDFRRLEGEHLAEALAASFEREKRKRFSPSEPPLIRFTAQRTTDDSFQFLMCFHHAILDGWSAATLLTSLFNTYSSLMRCETPREQRPAVEFRDYVAAELSALARPDHRAYWENVLADFPETRLPHFPEQTAGEQNSSRLYSVPIADNVAGSLHKVARSASVPLKSVLLAAHLRVLKLLTGSDDVATGVVTNARLSEMDGDRALGLFLNVLPIRVRISRGTWQDLIAGTFDAERAIMPYRRFPLGELQRMHGGELFETAFNFLHYHVYKNIERASDAELLDYRGFEQTNFAFTAHFSVAPASSRIEFHINYLTSQFSEAQIGTIAQYYVRALESMAAAPAQAQDSAPLLSASERDQLLYGWRAVRERHEPGQTIGASFAARARKTPERVAVTDGPRHIKYDELNAASNRVARYLVRAGVGTESIVGLAAERNLELVIAILGVLKSGAAYLPLDSEYPGERIRYMLEDARPRLVLATSDDLRTKLETSGAIPPGVRVVSLAAAADEIAKEDPQDFRCTASPDNLAYIIYTSGSTGTPKGVMVSHSNVLRLMAETNSWYHFSENDVWSLFHSYAFDVSVYELWGALLHGGRLVVVPFWVSRSPEQLDRLLSDEGVTVLSQTPSAFRQLREANTRSRLPLAQLRLIIFAGEALQPSSLLPWLANHADDRPKLINMYGITETTVHATYRRLSAAEIENGIRSVIGCAIPDLQIFILNSELEPAPVGVPGELYVGGSGVARGYLNRPSLTALRFVPNPFESAYGARLYRSGDLARRLADGDIEYLGRMDQQVKIRGFRVELGEIEAAMLQHPEVQEAIVVPYGAAAEQALAAYIVPQKGASPTGTQILDHVRGKLPSYMVPSVCVLLQRLPLTANGKLDRRALPDPMQAADRTSTEWRAPITETQQLIAEVWCDVLKLQHAGLEDNFFHLGGHSLLATQVVSRLRARMSVDIPLRTLFGSPTLEAFAARVDEIAASGYSLRDEPLANMRRKSRRTVAAATKDFNALLLEVAGMTEQEAAQRQQELTAALNVFPLSYSQEQIWQSELRNPGAMLLPLALRLKGDLDIARLEASFTEVVGRHDALRTVLVQHNGQPAQTVNPKPLRLQIPLTDLCGLGPQDAKRELRNILHEEAKTPFDLYRGPLYRVRLVRLLPDEHVLTITMHLLTSDGRSAGILLEEVSALYAAFIAGRQPDLPAVPAQLIDYALWERKAVDSPELQADLDYWVKQLQEANSALELPFDHPPQTDSDMSGGSASWLLPAALLEQLRALCAEHDATPFMLLTAVFKAMLFSLTGQRDLSIGIPDSGRNHPEAERLIGSFAQSLVLRCRVAPEASFVEHLQNVRALMLDAHAHKQMPFGKIVSVLRPGDEGHTSPLFRVMSDMIVEPPPAERSRDLLRIENLPPDSEELSVGNDMTMLFTDGPNGLRATLLYQKALFEENTAEAMLDRFAVALETAVWFPQTSLLDLCTPSDRFRFAASSI